MLDSRVARQDKRRFRKIHLARDPLHFRVAETATVGKNSKRVAFEGRCGKHIHLNESVAAMGWIHNNILSFVEAPFVNASGTVAAQGEAQSRRYIDCVFLPAYR